MGRINIGRLVIGGLVAGVLANALDFVINKYLLANEMTGHDPAAEPVGSTWSRARCRDLDRSWTSSAGMLLVFTYAAMRPRFGPGPTTAVIAGLCYGWRSARSSPDSRPWACTRTWRSSRTPALSLVSTLVPALGAAIYKEESIRTRSKDQGTKVRSTRSQTRQSDHGSDPWSWTFGRRCQTRTTHVSSRPSLVPTA